MTDTPNSYDQIPYSSYPYPRTHPDRLGTIARVFGLRPAPAESCRVLELGCASGGNLIPMAEQLPRAQFVGIDLSGRQIETGQGAIAELGLDNVTLRQGDIREIGEADGEFDYIVCHGVFSWVPRQVQDAILDIFRTRLREHGVGFVSYNTYPGWHMRESVREMMRWHVRQFEEPERRVEQARALVDFLAKAVQGEGNAHGLLLRRELEILSGTTSDYLFHEHLEEHNAPCYFHEFAERIAAADLQYLGEADPHTMLGRELPPEVSETVGRISPDIVALEQYMDFIRNRQFRQTLVCHARHELNRNVGAAAVEQHCIGFAGKPTGATLDLNAGVEVEFTGPGNLSLRSSRSVTKAAMYELGRHAPDVVPFDALWQATRDLLLRGGILVQDEAAVRRELAADLLECYFRGGIELRGTRPRFARTVPERPSVSPYARWQAAHADFSTNHRHERLGLDRATSHIVQLLDGTRDHAGMVEALAALVADGTLSISRDDQPIEGDAELRESLAAVVTETLGRLAEHALLQAEPEPASGSGADTSA